jgi:type VI secretion system protein
LVKPYGHALILVLLLVLLQACGIGTRARAIVGGKMRVQAQVADTANQHSPVALDLVVVYDQKLLKELSQLSAADWFDKRKQFRRDYPAGQGFDVWGWEWVPGQNVPLQKLPLKPRAKGGLIFVNYFSPGEHRARIEPNQGVYVELRETDFAVQPLR